MIKRLFYYFKLKMLLEMKDLIPFVKFVLHRYHDGTSLFWYCMKYKCVHYWMEWLVSQSLLYHAADIYTFPNASQRSTIIKKYNQARDFWSKNEKR